MKFITCILIFLYHTKLWIIQSTKTAAPQLHYEEIQFNQTLIQRWIPFYDDAGTPHTIGLNMTSSSASCDRETKGFTEQEIEKCQTTKGWICPVSLCGSVLSRKQTLKSHLHTVHNVSAGNPTIKYKEYEFDSTVSIPRSTFYRKRLLDDNGSDTDGIHQSSHEQNNVCHAPEPVESEKDINWEVSYEMENCDVTQYSQTDENGEEIMESVVHHQGEADMDLCDFHEDDDENDGDDDDNNEDDGGDEDSDGDGGNRENEYSRNCDEDTSPPLYIYPPSNQVQNSNISYRQHILSLCAFSLKHNLSGIAFKDLTKLIQIHMPDNSICETDVNYIKKMCANMDSEITVHEYCLKCSMLFTQDPDVTQCTTPGCNGQKKRIIQI